MASRAAREAWWGGVVFWIIVALLLIGLTVWVHWAEAGTGFLDGAHFPTRPIRPTPILGFHSIPAFAAWMGCPQATWYVRLSPRINAYFEHTKLRVEITQRLLNVFEDDPEAIAAVVAHETGHCFQALRHEADEITYEFLMRAEWEAEAHAHKILAVLGYDADAIIWRVRRTLADLNGRPYDQDVDQMHGSARALTDWACRHDGLPRVMPQAP